ncbi:hypothetical protein BKA70DRAFT_1241101 [Coprinopsis sp. MPI-PUGE-AT-0042]|nr:hypothetical protein BKA70DRAFT_1241101 [Coprinopsis sp. MPI-PUGE-AT-0042]
MAITYSCSPQDISPDAWAEDAMRVINCIIGLAGLTTQAANGLAQFKKRIASIFKALQKDHQRKPHQADSYRSGLMDPYVNYHSGASSSDGEKEKVIVLFVFKFGLGKDTPGKAGGWST